MKNITRREFVALAILAAIAAPTTAEAAEPRENWPENMQEDPTTEQNGILYLLHDRAAIVIETPNRRAASPPSRWRMAL